MMNTNARHAWNGLSFPWGVLAASTLLVAAQGQRALAAGPPAILDQLPANAPLALVVPSLSSLNQQVQMVANSMGVVVPEMANALAQFKAATQMHNGVDDDGAFAMVLTDATFGKGNAEQSQPPVVMLVPVSDYQAFLGNYGANAGGDSIAQVSMPGGQMGFARKLGDYAILGPDRAKIQAYAPGNAGATMAQSVGAFGASCIRDSKIFLYLNVESMAPTLGPMLQLAVVQMQNQMAQNPGAQMAEPVLNMYVDGVNAVLRDTKAAVFGLNADEMGISFTNAIQFKPDSPMSTMFRGGGQAKTHLDRLPDAPYLIAFGMDAKALALGPMVDNMLARFEALPQFAGLIKAMKPSMQILQEAKGYAQVTAIPEQFNMFAMATQNPFANTTIIEAEDPRALMKAYKASIEGLKDQQFQVPAAMNGQPPADGGQATITYATQYQENAVQIDGMSVDSFSVQMNLPPEMLNNPMAQMLQGLGATNGFITASDKYLIMTTTSDTGTLRRALGSLKQEGGLGSQAMIAQIRRHLTPDPAAEFYLDATGLVKIAAGFLPQLQVPANLPPIASSLSAKDSGMTGRLYVPMAVVRAGRDIAAQVQTLMGGMQQQGQQQPGGGPPPAPF